MGTLNDEEIRYDEKNRITDLEVGDAFEVYEGGNIFRVRGKENHQECWVEDLSGFVFFVDKSNFYFKRHFMDDEMWEAEKTLKALRRK
jgi:hypothetical protein